MTYHPDKHHRRSIRLPGYDYSQNGSYFITICTRNRECLFGKIADGIMRLNDAGQTVSEEWTKTAAIRNEIELDEWVVMPNHFHGILVVSHGRDAARCRDTARCGDTARRAPTVERFGQPVSGSIPTIIRSFKSAVSKRINTMRQTPEERIWQRNYYEHVIQNEKELIHIRQYILENPIRWETDRENPEYEAL